MFLPVTNPESIMPDPRAIPDSQEDSLPRSPIPEPVDVETLVSSVKEELGVPSPVLSEAESSSRVEAFLREKEDRVVLAGITIEMDPHEMHLPPPRSHRQEEDFRLPPLSLNQEAPIPDLAPVFPSDSGGRDTEEGPSIEVPFQKDPSPGPASSSSMIADRTSESQSHASSLPTKRSTDSDSLLTLPVSAESASFAEPGHRAESEVSRLTPADTRSPIGQVVSNAAWHGPVMPLPTRRLPSLSTLAWIVTVLVALSFLYYLYDDGSLNSVLPGGLQKHRDRLPPSHQSFTR